MELYLVLASLTCQWQRALVMNKRIVRPRTIKLFMLRDGRIESCKSRNLSASYQSCLCASLLLSIRRKSEGTGAMINWSEG